MNLSPFLVEQLVSIAVRCLVAHFHQRPEVRHAGIVAGDQLAIDNRRRDRDALDSVAESPEALRVGGSVLATEGRLVLFDVELHAPTIELNRPSRRYLRQRRAIGLINGILRSTRLIWWRLRFRLAFAGNPVDVEDVSSLEKV